MAALRTTLGEHWARTTVLIATEFGRTAAINGTGGTDHGTAAVAIVTGGGVLGGRVIADWPGLTTSHLYEGRDLAPTCDLDNLIAGIAAETFKIDPTRVARHLFPHAAQRPIAGIVL